MGNKAVSVIIGILCALMVLGGLAGGDYGVALVFGVLGIVLIVVMRRAGDAEPPDQDDAQAAEIVDDVGWWALPLAWSFGNITSGLMQSNRNLWKLIAIDLAVGVGCLFYAAVELSDNEYRGTAYIIVIALFLFGVIPYHIHHWTRGKGAQARAAQSLQAASEPSPAFQPALAQPAHAPPQATIPSTQMQPQPQYAAQPAMQTSVQPTLKICPHCQTSNPAMSNQCMLCLSSI